MSAYEYLVSIGDNYRVKAHEPSRARASYKAALKIGGEKDRHCLQMIGVCCQMMDSHPEAFAWFERALVDALPLEAAPILRDKAASHSAVGNHDAATGCLTESLRLLPYLRYPEEYAASLGFLARADARRGNLRQAIKHFALADLMLAQADNREYELYNSLAYAEALSQNQQHLMTRIVALKAYFLARVYGAKPHRQRAILIMIGGHRLYGLIKPRLRR